MNVGEDTVTAAIARKVEDAANAILKRADAKGAVDAETSANTRLTPDARALFRRLYRVRGYRTTQFFTSISPQDCAELLSLCEGDADTAESLLFFGSSDVAAIHDGRIPCIDDTVRPHPSLFSEYYFKSQQACLSQCSNGCWSNGVKPSQGSIALMSSTFCRLQYRHPDCRRWRVLVVSHLSRISHHVCHGPVVLSSEKGGAFSFTTSHVLQISTHSVGLARVLCISLRLLGRRLLCCRCILSDCPQDCPQLWASRASKVNPTFAYRSNVLAFSVST